MFGFLYLTFFLKSEEIQMELFLHDVIFDVSGYISWNFEINFINEKYPKTFWKHCKNVFK
jgi:hypothetical protein